MHGTSSSFRLFNSQKQKNEILGWQQNIKCSQFSKKSSVYICKIWWWNGLSLWDNAPKFLVGLGALTKREIEFSSTTLPEFRVQQNPKPSVLYPFRLKYKIGNRGVCGRVEVGQSQILIYKQYLFWGWRRVFTKKNWDFFYSFQMSELLKILSKKNNKWEILGIHYTSKWGKKYSQNEKNKCSQFFF